MENTCFIEHAESESFIEQFRIQPVRLLKVCPFSPAGVPLHQWEQPVPSKTSFIGTLGRCGHVAASVYGLVSSRGVFVP